MQQPSAVIPEVKQSRQQEKRPAQNKVVKRPDSQHAPDIETRDVDGGVRQGGNRPEQMLGGTGLCSPIGGVRCSSSQREPRRLVPFGGSGGDRRREGIRAASGVRITPMPSPSSAPPPHDSADKAPVSAGLSPNRREYPREIERRGAGTTRRHPSSRDARPHQAASQVEAAWASASERRARRVMTGESDGIAWEGVGQRAESDLRRR